MKTLFVLLAFTMTGCGTHLVADRPLPRESLGMSVLGSAAGEARTTHILHVHGMGTDREGGSEPLVAHLQRLMASRGPVTRTDDPRHELDIGPKPKPGTYGADIWDTGAADWERSRPYVRRVRLVAGELQVVVDEVNWWPFLAAVKCRRLVVPEADLSGPDRRHLVLCRELGAISQREYETVGHTRPRKSAAVLNRFAKHHLLNWGIADATITLGPLRQQIRAALQSAALYALGTDDTGSFAVVSHSLGSFALLDALQEAQQDPLPAAPKQALRSVMQRTNRLYFLANQFALLELGRLPPEASFVSDAVPLSGTGTSSLLEAWRAERVSRARGAVGPPRPDEVIAFHDPSDVLTFEVPPIQDVEVYNASVRNAPRWLWLLANPVRAHSGHLGDGKRATAVTEELFRTQ